MTKSAIAAAAVLVLCSFTGSASADSLQSRVVLTLSQAIAAQGNAALVQIRHDLKASALKTIEPFLPRAGDSSEANAATESSPAEAPAPTPLAQRLL